ncbi:MAG: hypothetical protein D3910_24525, partial [Candidatus Electrothrix sp. ATG2]|nr:hypothetical protein [Candidatus Electrothrix sp. ATG2]
LSQPNVTVELIEYTNKIQKFQDTVHTADRGQWNDVLVRPDGRISLPYLKEDIIVIGKTIEILSKELEERYREHVTGINVTVSILKATSYQACVLGDVKEADYYNLTGPTSLLQLIAQAGGFTREANMRQVVIISRGEDGKPEYTVRDVKKILQEGAADPMISQYDVVYVPRTWLADAAFTAEAIWSIIPMRFSASVYDAP